MADLKPEIEKIFAKHEQHFHVNDNPGSIVHGERSPEKKKELESEYYNLKLNILESDETIEGSRIEELKDQIEDKLVVGANTIELMDQWWWERPSGRSEAVLRDVLRELKKHCPDEPVWVRRVGHAWHVVLELLYLAVILGAFSVASTKFETVTVGMLVFVYNAVIGLGTGLGIKSAEVMAVIRQMYGEIGRSVRLKIPVAMEMAATKQAKDIGGWVLIHWTFTLIGSGIALWKICSAVFM